jgi:ankyrin repeat protein
VIPNDVYSRLAADGLTLLYRVAKHNFIQALRFLANITINLDIESPGIGTPLTLTVRTFSSKEAALLLLEKGASIYCRPKKTPASQSCTRPGKLQTLSSLGSSNTCIIVEAFPIKFPKTILNLQDSEGQTALHIAANKADFESVKLLVSLGADLAVEDKVGFTPIMFAITCGICARTRASGIRRFTSKATRGYTE